MSPVGMRSFSVAVNLRTACHFALERPATNPQKNQQQFMKPHWQGVFPAITTQMKKDGALDLDSTARHAEALIKSGVAGIIFLGSLGENQALAPHEKRRLIEVMVKSVNGRVPVLSGVAESSTAEACRYVRDGERLGLDGFMLMPAMLYRGDPRETTVHFRTTAKGTGSPVRRSNNPSSYPNDAPPRRIAEVTSRKKYPPPKETPG